MKHLRIEWRDGIAILWLDQSDGRVNKLSPTWIRDFSEALDEVEGREDATGIVLASAKEDSFVVGADLELLRGLRSPGEVRRLSEDAHALVTRLQGLPMPTVAAVHGAAMGGGLELALACTYRVVTTHPATKLALPEVRLGLTPGAGGTQTLPALLGLRSSLELLLTGKDVYPAKAGKLGLADALVKPHGLLRSSVEAAHRLAAGTLFPRRRRSLFDRALEVTPWTRRLIYRKASERLEARTRGNYPAPPKILECVRTGVEEGREAGLALEAHHFSELACTRESKALVDLFFLREEARANPWAGEERPVRRIGVLGAGLMGAGIAEVSVLEGLEVVVLDRNLELAASALRTLWRHAGRRVQKGALTPFEREVAATRLLPAADYAEFGTLDLVVEAVPEDLPLKRQILAEVEATVPEHCVLASNTSSIPIADLAAGLRRPEAVVGMHYFSPVPQVPLLEIVRSCHSTPWALATAFEVGRRQGKTPIVVNDGPGFYTTRVLAAYLNEAARTLEEGAEIEALDEAMLDWGFPMGPFSVVDMVGIEVAVKILGILRPLFEEQGTTVSALPAAMVGAGITGQKGGTGFYRYEDGEARGPNPKLRELLGRSGVTPASAGRVALQERLSLAFVNEAFRCLDAGVLLSSGDGDLGAVFGLGFPPFRGGPFRYAREEGFAKIVAKLRTLEVLHGGQFTPAVGLLRRADGEHG